MTSRGESTLRHAPLDAEEAALANALHRLPAVEPSPALDARVLAMARGAQPQTRATSATTSNVVNKHRRRSAWFGAGFGTLAASVFAAVIGVQMGWFSGSLPSEPAPSPAADSRLARPVAQPQAAPAQAEEESPVEVEFLPAPAASAAPAPAQTAGAAASTRKEPAVARKAAPPPPPPAPAAPATAAVPELRQRMEMQEQAAKQVFDGLRASEMQGVTALPHWREDALLPLSDWLERIRERVRHGDRFGAERSLRTFQQQHPGQQVPDDLLPLLAE